MCTFQISKEVQVYLSQIHLVNFYLYSATSQLQLPHATFQEQNVIQDFLLPFDESIGRQRLIPFHLNRAGGHGDKVRRRLVGWGSSKSVELTQRTTATALMMVHKEEILKVLKNMASLATTILGNDFQSAKEM